MKNYVALGLYLAYKADTENTAENKKILETMVKSRCKNAEDKIELRNAKNLEDLVTYCQVTKTQNKCFINMNCTDTEDGKKFMELMANAFNREGKRQWDPPPPKPVHRDLKEALAVARRRR